MVAFSSKKAPAVDTPDGQALAAWVEDELQNFQRENLENIQAVDLQPLYSAPLRPRTGMFVYADGVKYDPGFGEGPYYRNSSGLWIPFGGVEYLLADRTYFVRSDGNDNNLGKVNSAGGAFATWAKAVAVVTQKINFAGRTVTIKNGSGVGLDPGINLNSSWSGGGSLVFDLGGGVSNPTVTGTLTISAPQVGDVTIQNGTIRGAYGISNSDRATVLIGTGISFGAVNANQYQMQATTNGALINALSQNYTISGSGCAGHQQAADQGQILNGFNTRSISANLTYSNAFSYAVRAGLVADGGGTFDLNPGGSGPFTVTGRRYVTMDRGVHDVFGGGANHFPGSLPGLDAGILNINMGAAGATTLTTGAFTQIPFANVLEDSLGGFNTTTHLYTPNIPGDYLVGFSVYARGTAAAGYPAIANIRKNNVAILAGGLFNLPAGALEAISSATGIVNLNGTTDNIDFWCFTSLTAAAAQSTNSSTFAWAYKL